MAEIGIEAFFDTRTATVTYLVWDPETNLAAVIDPVLDFDPKSGKLWRESVDRVLAAAGARKLKIERVLETHAHADHLSAAQVIKRRTTSQGGGARVAAGSRIVEVQQEFAPRFAAFDIAERGVDFDDLYEDGATFALGRLNFRVMHTPGHTPACVTYVAADAAFVGDTLFMPDFGTARCDFPGGDAHTLWRSTRRILEAAAGDARLYRPRLSLRRRTPGARVGIHRGSAACVQPSREGRDHRGRFRRHAHRARDRRLDPPVLLLPALQVNIRAGKLPPTDPGGRTRLPAHPGRSGSAG